ELITREDVEQAVRFASQKNIPLILLGGGSNTIFADGVIEALVVRIKAEQMDMSGNRVTVQSGKILASMINELGEQGLDLSALTGIPGSVGGAIFGNAGQGPKGVWIDSFVVNVTAFIGGEWKTFTKEECKFRYRESIFKNWAYSATPLPNPLPRGEGIPIIWEATLEIPSGDPAAIHDNVEALLKKRFETQPHLKTAGSCFKAVGETPAWQLIDKAGLRGLKIGGVEISAKHANFLMKSEDTGKFSDAKAIVEKVRETIPEGLEVEMRFIQEDGTTAF
ncbi:FAD-binding protein, partial [Candidatus Peregrinibacteria bacterium]|nr:FAD-binding protein [Candidatus Peregrinibacteria bacterium]